MRRLTVLSHNLFWFQGVPFLTDAPGAPSREVMVALVDLYRRIEPDLFCFQEVQSGETFRLMGECLGLEGAYCPGRVLTQYGGAVFWRAGTLLKDAREAGDPPQRVWQVVTVEGEGGGSLAVCNIHLPSSRQLGKEAAARRRVEELRVATKTVPEVVLGDFNEWPGGAVSDFMAGQGYADAAELTGQGDRPTSIGDKRGDQIWVHERVRDRVVEYGVLVKDELATSLEGKTYLSDHLPLWVRLDMGGGA